MSVIKKHLIYEEFPTYIFCCCCCCVHISFSRYDGRCIALNWKTNFLTPVSGPDHESQNGWNRVKRKWWEIEPEGQIGAKRPSRWLQCPQRTSEGFKRSDDEVWYYLKIVRVWEKQIHLIRGWHLSIHVTCSFEIAWPEEVGQTCNPEGLWRPVPRLMPEAQSRAVFKFTFLFISKVLCVLYDI